MLPYTAYLRVYEPVTAFPEPARTLWTAYAESRRRPAREHALEAEHRDARRRLVAAPPIVAPERESGDAYVRLAQDMIYVAPWDIRLRSWLALARFREETPALLAGWHVPPQVVAEAERAFDRWRLAGRTLHPHIRSSNWHVPLPWFVPFTAAERSLTLGTPPADGGQGGGPATASATRTLIYLTSMREARGRIAAALPAVEAAPGDGARLGAGALAALDRWLAAFHPGGLVELDYGGLVHLLDDRSLCADESVAEIGVALAALARGQTELWAAMHQRLETRWRPVRALQAAN
ncbi:hypothetical protein [Actinomadura sp. 21ATH]|uniref:hypothetical protein n=1 Tax=Actinomadura sp. 21ATH TaxID=1735444 RepID=UPI0035C21CE2